MTQPKVPIVTGKWYRMRFLISSVLDFFDGTLPSQCEWKLLNKDTVPILEGMRDVTQMWMYPGSRADFAVKCNEPGEFVLESEFNVGLIEFFHHTPPFFGQVLSLVVTEGDTDDGPLPVFKSNRPCHVIDTRSVISNPDYVEQRDLVYAELAQFDFSGSEDASRRLADGEDDANYPNFCVDGSDPISMSEEIWSTVVGEQAPYTECAVDPESGLYLPFPVCVCPFSFICLAENTCMSCDEQTKVIKNLYGVNGCAFADGTISRGGFDWTNGGIYEIPEGYNSYSDFSGTIGESCAEIILSDGTLQVGSLIEWITYGAHFHPIHFHVNPYQWVKTDFTGTLLPGVESVEQFNEFTGNYFKEGDFGDSMMIPNPANIFHQQLDQFASKMVMHCHILPHEDWGMMMVFDINGTTGAADSHYALAKDIDPTCYLDKDEATYELTEGCDSDDDCPTGWSCSSNSRRNLQFGYHIMKVCSKD
uniref:Plastocyanin-like domain-containing protein n=1 Tax=Aureoumbra lagunensis TaxID=44058 RepID=A0A7S3JZX4_9STRA|mmetsp:Transcript_9225/g.12773  ORF Transcript_9225/g.12773 Transcript_9225/m.12773 type:complete len:476 (+) Transcript_9225:905-2332(+)